VRLRLAAAILSAAIAAALAVEAHAAALNVFPAKPCYGSGEKVLLGGTGFSPNGSVRITSDGRPVAGPPLPTTASGGFGAVLTVNRLTGGGTKTYAAIDGTNATLTASIGLRVIAPSVRVRPLSGTSGKRIRIRARGFATGRTLYAHVVRGRYRRNVRLGRLKGACHTLSVRRRIFRRGTRIGRYRVQFDTRRRYSRRTVVRVRYRVRVVDGV
jgi:hypothetical protein